MEARVSDTSKVPIFCPVCTTVMVGKNDPSYYKLFECCEDCGMDWAEKNREKWRQGWRPKKTEIKEQIENRRLLIINDILRLRGS